MTRTPPPTDVRAAVVAELLEAAKWMNHGVPDYVKRAAALLAADGERLAELEAMEARLKGAVQSHCTLVGREHTHAMHAHGSLIQYLEWILNPGKEDPR